jgi:hydrogenase expression/formation protein HypC
VSTLHDDGTATVELGGVRQRVSTALVEGVAPGDYVVVHVGYALARLDEAEAQKTLRLLSEMEGAR